MNHITITSQDILDNIEYLKKAIKEPDIAQNLKDIKTQQAKDEAKMLATTSPCAIPMMERLRNNISGLEANKLKDYITDELYNANVMTAAMCTTDSLIYLSPNDAGSFYLNNHIRQYINDLRQIGQESAEGYAMLGSLKSSDAAKNLDKDSAKDLFVVKAPRNIDNDTLAHELVVGLFGTNKLRKFIPNFSYIYGGFKCSPPIIDPDTKEVVTWCTNNDNAVNYILYENINPSVTAEKYLETCTVQEFLKIYLQIVYSLRKAVTEIDFTHYDLHAANVLIRQVDNLSQFQIAYDNEYLTTDCVATFIDYGRSHVMINGEHFGYTRDITLLNSVFPYRSWIMADIYRFLMACMIVTSYPYNVPVYQEAVKIWRFFDVKDDPEDAIQVGSQTYGAFPLTVKTEQLKIDDLIEYIKQNCDCRFISDKRSNLPLLDCEKMCATEDVILNAIGLQGEFKIPNTILDFYDLFAMLSTQKKEDERLEVAVNFQYFEAMYQHEINLLQMSQQIYIDVGQITLVEANGVSIDDIMNIDSMMQMRDTYLNLVKTLDKIIDFMFQLNVGRVVALFYSDETGMNYLKDLLDTISNAISLNIHAVSNILLANRKYLDQIYRDPLTTQLLKADSRLIWYFTSSKVFDSVMNRVIADFTA